MANWPEKEENENIRFNVDGFKAIEDSLKSLDGLNLQVGITEPNKKAHQDYEYYGKGGSDATLGQVAAVHEYGATVERGGKAWRIPARPFMRPVLGVANQTIVPEFLNKLHNIIIASSHKTWIGDKRIKKYAVSNLNKIGEQIAEMMKARILSHISPSLKKRTIERKRKAGLPMPNTPLVATGTLWQNIRYLLRDRGRFVAKNN